MEPITHCAERARAIRRIITLIAFAAASLAHAEGCTRHDAVAADAQVDRLDTWDKFDTAFIQYAPCDEGEIAEGNSEAVARLLVDHWSSLPRLGELIGRDPPLKAFVLRHVDSTLDTDDLGKIAALARSSCPADMKRFCRDLANAAKRASR